MCLKSSWIASQTREFDLLFVLCLSSLFLIISGLILSPCYISVSVTGLEAALEAVLISL